MKFLCFVCALMTSSWNLIVERTSASFLILCGDIFGCQLLWGCSCVFCKAEQCTPIAVVLESNTLLFLGGRTTGLAWQLTVSSVHPSSLKNSTLKPNQRQVNFWWNWVRVWEEWQRWNSRDSSRSGKGYTRNRKIYETSNCCEEDDDLDFDLVELAKPGT
jgi:hypothetical protein